MSLNVYQRTISDAFDSRNWNYILENVSQDESTFSINFTSKRYGKTCCKISISETGICDIKAVLPIKCQLEQHMELCYYLAQYNCFRRYSTLRLDINDGEIYNFYSFVFNQATTPTQFLKYFNSVEDIEDSVMDDLISMCNKSTTVSTSNISNYSQSTPGGKNGKHKISL